MVGMTEAEARRALRDAGLAVRRLREPVDTSDQHGFVIDQAPLAGEKLRKGSRVTIRVGRFTPPTSAEPGVTPTPTVSPAP